MTDETWALLAAISQVAIVVFTPIASFLVARRNRWGWVLGLLGQPFWFVTSLAKWQPGLFILNIISSANWGYGFYYNWFGKPLHENGSCPHCGGKL